MSVIGSLISVKAFMELLQSRSHCWRVVKSAMVLSDCFIDGVSEPGSKDDPTGGEWK